MRSWSLSLPIEQVEATLPFLPEAVRAMVRLQLVAGMRPGEVMKLHGCDLTFGEPCWENRPSSHKNAWRGQKRVVQLGPQAQEIIKPFLKADPATYLFDPRETVRAARRRQHEAFGAKRQRAPSTAPSKRKKRRKLHARPRTVEIYAETAEEMAVAAMEQWR